MMTVWRTGLRGHDNPDAGMMMIVAFSFAAAASAPERDVTCRSFEAAQRGSVGMPAATGWFELHPGRRGAPSRREAVMVNIAQLMPSPCTEAGYPETLTASTRRVPASRTGSLHDRLTPRTASSLRTGTSGPGGGARTEPHHWRSPSIASDAVAESPSIRFGEEIRRGKERKVGCCAASRIVPRRRGRL